MLLKEIKGNRVDYGDQNYRIQQNESVSFNVEGIGRWLTEEFGKKASKRIVFPVETLTMDEDRLLALLRDNDLELDVLEPFTTKKLSKEFIRGYKREDVNK